MADNTVNIGVNVSDNGSISKVTKNVEVLRDLLVNTAAIAARINVGGGAMPFGGAQGTPRAARAAAPSGGGVTVAGGSTPAAGGTSGSRALSEQSRYGMFRGVAGEAGSAAGNFAEQAQGANSLVRAYATVAANVYALTAAFSALSKAADISNLSKGLDMLGASSGKNLSGLSQKLIEITEGGLSVADSMKAVAKASSAGISTENIERLAKVAKQSAQALGLDMGTAFDRLSRGVTKLEPELLDELGLFTKIGPATAEYARLNGKSVSSLTDFEKRQAFTNAVLDEGEKKFGAIALSSNGYNIILAKLANAFQKILEGINSFIKPVIDFLSQSPTGLYLALGLILKMVLGSMLPALKDFRLANKAAGESLKEQAAALTEIKKQAMAYRIESIAGTAAKRLENAEIRSGLALRKLSMDTNLSPKSMAALTTSATATTDAETLKALEKRRNELRRDIESPLRIPGAAPDLYAQKQLELKGFEEKIAAQKMLTTARKQYNEAEGFVGPPRPLTRRQEIEESKLLAATQKNSIVQRGLEVQAIDGTRAGFTALWRDMALAREGLDSNGKKYEDGTKKLQGFALVSTAASGSIKLVGAALASVAGALQAALGWISLLIGVFTLLRSVFSTSEKEAAAFSDSTATLNGALKNVGATLDNISTKKFLDATGIEQTANAFNDLSKAAAKNVKDFDKLTRMQGALDTFLDKSLGLIGQGTRDDLARSLSGTVVGALKLMEEGGAKEAFKTAIKNIIPTEDLGSEKSIFKALGTFTGSDLIAAFDKINPALEKANKELTLTAANITGLKSGFTETSKLVTDLATSLKLTDEQGKLGTSMLADSAKLGKALDKPKEALIALKLITDDFNLMSLFPKDTADQLNAAKAGIDKVSIALQQAKVDSANFTEQLSIEKASGGTTDNRVIRRIQEKLEDANKRVAAAEKESSDITAKFKTLGSELFVAAFKKIEISLKNAMQEAAILTAKGYLSVIKSAGGITAEREGALKLQEFQIQKDVINANYAQIQESTRLRLATEQSTAAEHLVAAALQQTFAYLKIEQQAKVKAKAQEDLVSVTDRKVTGDAGDLTTGGSLIRAKKVEMSKALGQDITTSKAKDALITELTLAAKNNGQSAESIYAAADKAVEAAQRAVAVADRAVAINKMPVGEQRKVAQAATRALPTNASQAEQDAASINRDAVAAAGSTLVAATALQGQLSKIDAAIKVAKLETFAAKQREKEVTTGKEIDIEIAAKKAIVDRTAAQLSYLGLYNEQLTTAKQAAEAGIQEAETRKLLLPLEGNLVILREAEARLLLEQGAHAKDVADATQGIASAEKEIDSAKKTRQEELNLLTTKNLVERLTGVESLAVIERERQVKTLEFENTIKQTRLANLEAELGMRQALGTVSDKEMAIRTAELSISKQELEYSQQKLNLENTIAAATAKNIIDRTGLRSGLENDKTLTPEQRTSTLTIFDENAKKNLDILNLQKASIDAQNASKLYGIEISKQTQLQQAAEKKILEDQKYAMDNLVASTNSLAIVLGDVGKKFGEGLVGILQANQDSINARTVLDKKYAADKVDIETKTALAIKNRMEDANSTQEDLDKTTLAGKQELAALEQKNAKDSANLEFAKNAKVLSSFKNMFSEKTAAYKILDKTEKVMHFAKLAMEAKETAMSLWAEGKKLFAKVFTAEAGTAALAESTAADAALAEVGAAATVSASVPGIFAKFSEQMGFWGWAAAAAVVAALGFSGSGSKAPPAGFKAEEQQKVQGTGQMYKDGVLVNTGGGALGDPTQKSESVANGIANIEKYSFDGLDYSNKMLEALQAIKENTSNLGTAIIKAFPGLNIKPADITSGNWLFGKDTTSVVDAGFSLAGSFGDLIDQTGKLSTYINSITTSTGFLGLGGSSTPNSTISTIENTSDIARVVSKIVGSVGDALSTAGSTLGLGMSKDILAKFREIDLSDELKTSILGLKPSEQADAILSVISSGLDSAAKLIFSSLTDYQKAGETFGDTVLRLANDSMVVNKNFQMLGVSLAKLPEGTSAATTAMYDEVSRAQEKLRLVKTARNTVIDNTATGGYVELGATYEELAAAQKRYDDAVNKVNIANAGTTTNNIALYESIIKASGGLDKFTENTKAFSDAFLTDREKITPKVAALRTALLDLGYGTINTRDEFKQLILGFKITDNSTAETYAKLIALSTGFDAVAQFEEKLADSRDSQTDTIRKLIGTETSLTASLKASRDKELKALDPSLVATQKYINALTDEVAARDKAATAVKSTIDSLKGSVKTLTDYQTSLATGSQGTMTPEQRYAALQQELLATQAAAMGPTDTPAQLAAQQAAASKLPQAASAFLDASKVLNASSDKYAQDLEGVQKIIADTITSVTGTQTLAEKNLEALGPLVSIDANTKSTAELMQAFINAQTETAKAKTGIDTTVLGAVDPAALKALEIEKAKIISDASSAALDAAYEESLIASAAKTAADKIISDAKAAADKTIADKAAADKATADKATADKAAADKAAADKIISDKVAADSAAYALYQATLSNLNTNTSALNTSTDALNTTTGKLNTGTGTLSTNTGALATSINTLNTNTGTLNTNTDTLATNINDNTESIGLLNSKTFADLLATAVSAAIDTQSIVTAVGESSGAIIRANATVVAAQTEELVQAQLDAASYDAWFAKNNQN